MAAAVFCTALLLSAMPVCAKETGGESETASSLAGTMSGMDLSIGAGYNTGSTQMMFARLQLEMASQVKGQTADAMKKLEAQQEVMRQLGMLRNKLNDFMMSMPEKQRIPLPDNLKKELIQSGICRADMPMLQQNADKETVRNLLSMIDAKMEELSIDVQKQMVAIQEWMGSYNSYVQDANNAVMSSYQELQSPSRGGTMLDGDAGMLFTGFLTGGLSGIMGVLLAQRAGRKKS